MHWAAPFLGVVGKINAKLGCLYVNTPWQLIVGQLQSVSAQDSGESMPSPSGFTDKLDCQIWIKYGYRQLFRIYINEYQHHISNLEYMVDSENSESDTDHILTLQTDHTDRYNPVCNARADSPISGSAHQIIVHAVYAMQCKS